MLSYELCRSLKEAGYHYPIPYDARGWKWSDVHYLEGQSGGCFDCGDNFEFFDEDENRLSTVVMDFDPVEYVYIPTLEELIEACGRINLLGENCIHAEYGPAWLARKDVGRNSLGKPNCDRALSWLARLSYSPQTSK